MSKVIGTAPLSFKGKDGSLVEGVTLYTSAPLDPKVGDEVEILFNRFGKVATVRKVSDPLEVVDIEI